MALKLITPPAPVVTWEEADTHLRLDGDASQRAYVETLIAGATSWLDGYSGILGRALGTQIWDLIYDSFPSGAIQVPLPPIQSVTGVYYIDADGAEQTVPASDYYVDTASSEGWVVPSGSWPSTMSAANSVRIRFVAGYTEVPAAIKVAILLMVGHWYAHRETVAEGSFNELPFAANALLAPFRRMSF